MQVMTRPQVRRRGPCIGSQSDLRREGAGTGRGRPRTPGKDVCNAATRGKGGGCQSGHQGQIAEDKWIKVLGLVLLARATRHLWSGGGGGGEKVYELHLTF